MVGQTADLGPALAAFTALVALSVPLAVGVAKVVDFVRNLTDTQDKLPHWVWSALALIVGIALTVGWGINLMSGIVAAVPALSEKAGTQNTLGQVLTGIAVGGMAGFWHDKMAAWAAQHGNP